MSPTPPGPDAPTPDPDVVIPEDERAEEELARHPVPNGTVVDRAPDEEDLAKQVLSEPSSKVSIDGVEVPVADVDPGGQEDVPDIDEAGVGPARPENTDPSGGPRH
jgi:hypothetical protein